MIEICDTTFNFYMGLPHVQKFMEFFNVLPIFVPTIENHSQLKAILSRAGGASPVAQAMAGPIFETFQDFRAATCLCRLEICVFVVCKQSAR